MGRKWGPLLGAGAFLLLAWLERRRPLRRNVEPKLRREARNVAVAALGAPVVLLAETPVVMPLAALAEKRRWGLLQRSGLPYWLELPAALLLMDYTFYLWHILLHRVPFLWRFHLVHHTDLDLDASTALRFHAGELLVSIPWRAAQVLAIGMTPRTFAAWQAAFLLCILFHHSEVRLPLAWERRMVRVFVTPRMHGIHHSVVERETNSNWSSGLTVWDWLHGTLRLDVPDDVTIGVPEYRDPDSVTLGRIMRMPLTDVAVEPREALG
jgi:sterol desaturase/sphingolipid hydroxylase (fatty acid hydroxylase superfamily)